MAVLSILKFPDPRLHTVAQPVSTFDVALQTTIDDMFETMYSAKGVGLAATQVDIHRRIVVVDTSEERDQPLVFINPEIVAQSVEQKEWEEGCLSVPEIYETVTRPDRVRVRVSNVSLDDRRVDFELAGTRQAERRPRFLRSGRRRR